MNPPFIVSLVSIFCLLFHGSLSIQTRIVDGARIDIMQVPFMLSLRLKDSHVCGATIISRNWGLTAAHCVTTYVGNVTDYSVRSGSSYWKKDGEIHNITSIIWHELYDDLNSSYDIAVFRVDPPFKFDETTSAIDLPGKDYVYDKWALIAGWGYYRRGGNVLSQYLRYAEIPMLDRAECSDDYAGRYEITAEQVCYGTSQGGGKDACKGDSGGPLFTNDSIILGITSWGEDCGSPISPGVYTTIFLMLEWISEKTGVTSQL